MKTQSQTFSNILHTINSFKGISLSEMDEVSLMRRTDTKFIIHVSLLNSILKELKNEYCVLDINHKRLMNYATLYFDTPKFKFYYDHHNKRIKRIKIRQRQYVDSGLTFLEIKRKNSKGETKKSRIRIDDFETNLSIKSRDFIQSTLNKEIDLKPSLLNSFNRITLVNLIDKERVTIDLTLTYSLRTKKKMYNSLVIIEVKQSKLDRTSKIITTLRKYNNTPNNISKYCIGIINLYKNVKYNLFKKKILKLNKIAA